MKKGKLIAMDVKVDHKVLYAKYAGTESLGARGFLIQKDSDILAVVTD